MSSVMLAAPIAKIGLNLLLCVGGPDHCIINTWRRNPLLKAGFLGAALFLALFANASERYQLTVYMFLYNVCEETLWTVGGVYWTEQFPTSIRAFASSLIFTVGHVGTVAAGAFLGELMQVSLYLPMVVLCACMYMGFIFACLLPPGYADSALADRPS